PTLCEGTRRAVCVCATDRGRPTTRCAAWANIPSLASTSTVSTVVGSRMFHVRADDRTRGDLGQRRRAFYPEARSRHNGPGLGLAAGKRHASEGHLAHLTERLLVVPFVGRVDEVPPLVDAFARGLEGSVARGADTVRQSVMQRLELRCCRRARWEPGCGCGL